MPDILSSQRTGTRRASRAPRVQHLVAADESSLTELETVLATLPLCAVGRVFVEVPDAAHIVPIVVPPRMTISWLARDRRSGAPGTGRSCGHGEALARAVNAWADEMMCGEDDTTTVTLLGGFLGTAEIVDHLMDERGVEPDRIHAPERFRLLPVR
ncbi:SIP domain-containing protein [Microbacterium sp. SORGH_AS_0888]|uniref:SIP domain-containing protein n=1 Tax=Microbacterium sp. SORGH_AS_0888 TaxID=3041791 RepID=UPI002780A351|nr:SIP domain-containing protein [Microbacterium sp. SORGH_AS_0888]MDQ1127969.1 NADPH-dependent ferric siderophore reductase [Microbacterium sp. SORGH_AS_0888]